MSRSPRWALEATAWAASLVLLAGVAVAVSGVIDTDVPQPPVAASEEDTPAVVEPVVTAPSPTPAPVVTQAPVAKPKPAPAGGSSYKPRATAASLLGPPPGPQADRVPTAFAAPEDRYAFLVGVTDYPAPTHDTIGSANDVLFIRQYLINNGWKPQNIRVFTDRQVTGRVVREGLTWLAGKSVPGTFTFFHYSGHVKQAGGHEKLWPADRDFVLDTEVAAILKRGVGRMWVDIAGCEAGGFVEDLPSAHRLVTASSLRTQKSYEYPQWRMSVWTGLLFDISMNQRQADADKNGVATVGEALRYSTYYAQAITLGQKPHGRQTPQVFGDAVLGWTLSNPPA